MKQAFYISALLVALSAVSASACTVEYKAKKSNPTDYRHTTITIPASECTSAKARAYVQGRIGSQGWQVLAIVNVSG